MSCQETMGADERVHDPHADVWATFVGAEAAAAFCQSWLAIQAAAVGNVMRGLVLLREDDDSFAPGATFPGPQTDLTDLAGPARRCLKKRTACVDGKSAAPDSPLLLAYPIEHQGALRGAVVLEMGRRDDRGVTAAMRAVHWGMGWLVAMLHGEEIERLGQIGLRARQVIDAMLRVAEAQNLEAAAHLAVDAAAERLGVLRASIGLVDSSRGVRIRLQAISATAWFDRRSEVARRIENAMEEAWDQHATAASPPVQGLPTHLDVAHRDLAGRDAASSVLVQARGEVVGVICCERSSVHPFDSADVVWLEAFARALGPVLALHRDAHRWISGRMRAKLGDAIKAVADPRRPTARVSIVAGVIAVAAVIMADGQHRISAPSTLEGIVQRAVVAPFDGFVREAFHKAGHRVTTGEILAVLDDRDLLLEAARRRSEQAQHERRYRDALARGERAEARIAAAQLAEAEAQLALAEERLARARLTAPFDGVVVSGDLSQLLGSPVEKGKPLFEVAPLDAYRVILRVDEADIRSVQAGQRGQLLLSGLTGDPLSFTVRNVAAASPEDGRNVFAVEATLDDTPARLRPGMEGVGKIDAGERRLLWIWTHRFTNWLRLKMWEWLP